MSNKKNKVLFYDIETKAQLGEVWGMYDQNVLRIVREWELLSMAFRWQGQKKVHCISRPDFKTEKDLVIAAWDVLDQADILVAHHGDSFDVKKLYAKFAQYGLGPPSPTKSVDTRKVAKRYFMFTSNKLDHLGDLLGVGRKKQTGGYDLWVACGEDLKAVTAAGLRGWKKMTSYNKQDVILLEKVYNRLLPFITNHPSVEGPQRASCHKCGSTKLKSHGWHYTKTSAYRRFVCKNCGGYCRDRTADKAVKKPKYVAI